MAETATLERAADDAIAALDDKGAWYVKDFEKHRSERLLEIRRMIESGEFPEKQYKPKLHHDASGGKDRDIYPLPMMPWSILYHAMKLMLEPIVERVLIYDSSAGRRGKGQTFGALRTRKMIRRNKSLTHFVKIDLKKFYQSIPHSVVTDALRRYIDDERFMRMFEATVLDYEADIEEQLTEERRRKLAYCQWADREPQRETGGKRGIVIGSCISQLIGNLVLSGIDHMVKERLRQKGYHRHCDDIVALCGSKEEANRLLGTIDRECNRIGLCVKANSFAAPLKDENKGIKGRSIDYVGYVFSRDNMRMRKRTKKRFARKMSRIKSRSRRQEVCAAYFGIAKWGRCKNLWRRIMMENKMSFKMHGITTSIVSELNGRRIFDVMEKKISMLASSRQRIFIHDFEDGLTIKDKGNKCSVLFKEEESGDEYMKFITSSSRIIDKLRRAREMEAAGEKIFPCETTVYEVRLNGGRYTYDMD